MRLHSLILTLALTGVCLGAEPAPTPQANEPTYAKNTKLDYRETQARIQGRGGRQGKGRTQGSCCRERQATAKFQASA